MTPPARRQRLFCVSVASESAYSLQTVRVTLSRYKAVRQMPILATMHRRHEPTLARRCSKRPRARTTTTTTVLLVLVALLLAAPQQQGSCYTTDHTLTDLLLFMPNASRLIQSTFALGRAPFKTFDPFLFCVYHLDTYPNGGENMGPDPALLRSRDLGMDFSYEGGWSMYHGAEVPGFPSHPHRGFETVTVARQGFVDHADSMGYTARYGNGDTQWMTAGKGIQHSEMFPLLNRDKPNTLDLFQIWLNLPKKDKMCPPAFEMFWSENTPRLTIRDEASGQDARVQVVAGALASATPLAPPSNSWAASAANDVAIWIVTLPPGCTIALPAATSGDAVSRALYMVQGNSVAVREAQDGAQAGVLTHRTGAKVDASLPLVLTASKDSTAEILLLQGKPIGEPVAQHGPMVMNTREEIRQAFEDYQRTQYGGWPWKEHDHMHPRDAPRHAMHNGVTEHPPKRV